MRNWCCLKSKPVISFGFQMHQGGIPLHNQGSLRLNSQQHLHVTRHSNINSFFPKYNRVIEGGRTFAAINYLATMEQLKPKNWKCSIIRSLYELLWKFILSTRLIDSTLKFL